MKRLRFMVSLLGLLCCSLAGSLAAETLSALQRDATGWRDLQPAAGLAGWTRLPIPPTNHLGRAQWHVDQPGVLTCDGDGGHEMLQLNEQLTNGIFHAEFCFTPLSRTNRNFNSGVFIRNSADGWIWHQAQLTPDGGYLFGNSPVQGVNHRFKAPVSERRMKPVGEWNTVELTARGNVLSVWLNGAEVCAYDQCELPQGFIAVESEGYPVKFRNLKYKALP